MREFFRAIFCIKPNKDRGFNPCDGELTPRGQRKDAEGKAALDEGHGFSGC
jgi:hypothetical protein